MTSIDEAIPRDVIKYLRERARRGDTILFLGAGFSQASFNTSGKSLPLGPELRAGLWAMCFPTEAFDPESRLQDLFEHALARHAKDLKTFLERELGVDASTLPPWYAKFFALPWYRAYTLNVDNLPDTVNRQVSLERPIRTVSAMRPFERVASRTPAAELEVVHLNGKLEDAPDGVTFSTTQYAERLAGQEPLYAQCAADVLARPVVFVGTPLDESPLWQHVEFRRRGRTRGREFRPRSLIITPFLDRARKELLERQFNVEHLAMTAEEFASLLQGEVADVSTEGLTVLRKSFSKSEETKEVPRVGLLSADEKSVVGEYLLGRAPSWSDIREERAARREIDDELAEVVRSLLAEADAARGVLLLTGTAGSGKSTAAMRLGLALTNSGMEVGWIDTDIDIAPSSIRASMLSRGRPPLLIIDDADRYGADVPNMAAEIAQGIGFPLVMLCVRSGRADRIADRLETLEIPAKEINMPHLADRDIDGLLETLALHHRLGVLKGMPRKEQVAAFRGQAGRQLLVAMLSATSGRKFEERISDEMQGLDADARAVYGLVAVATALRFGLTRDEILLAVGYVSNATLQTLDTLQRRGLIVQVASGELRVRHRVIAEVIVKAMSADGTLAPTLTGLCVAAASKVGPATRRSEKAYRRVKAMMNHDWIFHEIGCSSAKQVYNDIETLMSWDYHYWLQRGSLEVECGDLSLAENFLNQAMALNEDDFLVQTEFAYLQLRLAVADPSAEGARRALSEGFALIEHVIRTRGASDPHPYHILGRHGLAWSRRGDVTSAEREELLIFLVRMVDAGYKNHPRDERLRELYVELQNERLGVS